MKKIFTLLSLALLLSSCNVLRTIKILKKGKIEQKEFKVEIPFEYRMGFIFLKVTISSEEYEFLLDTGAPNAISIELAEKLNLISRVEQEVSDSQGESSKLGFTTIEEISIGNINFLNTGAAIADFKLSHEIECLKIDGIIGSNLMKKAIWKFDYQNQIITITNSADFLNIPDTALKIPFYSNFSGKVYIDIELNEITQKKVIVDLGSNGDISLSKVTFDKIVNNNPGIPQTYFLGQFSSGLYGLGKIDTSHFCKLSSISFGDVSLEKTIVSFSNKSALTIGNNFFKNYDLIINWFANEVTLLQKSRYEKSTLSTYGFSYSLQDSTLIISGIYENMENLKIGDQILKIGDTNFDKVTNVQYCEIFEIGLLNKEINEVEITVLRDNQELNFTISKMNKF